MRLKTLLFFAMALLLSACVKTGGTPDPLATKKGRDKAVDAYVQLAIGYLSQGQNEQAKEPLIKALKINSKDAEANHVLAIVFQREMEPKLAEEYYKKSLSESPNNARILNNYGGFLYDQQRYKDAYEAFTKAAEDNMYVERSRVFENLGMTALKMNDRPKARENFERALRMNAQRPVALLEMAQFSFDDQMYAEALGYYQGYLQLAPQSPRSLMLGIRLAQHFNNKDEEASYALMLEKLYPSSAENQEYRAGRP